MAGMGLKRSLPLAVAGSAAITGFGESHHKQVRYSSSDLPALQIVRLQCLGEKIHWSHSRTSSQQEEGDFRSQGGQIVAGWVLAVFTTMRSWGSGLTHSLVGVS